MKIDLLEKLLDETSSRSSKKILEEGDIFIINTEGSGEDIQSLVSKAKAQKAEKGETRNTTGVVQQGGKKFRFNIERDKDGNIVSIDAEEN